MVKFMMMKNLVFALIVTILFASCNDNPNNTLGIKNIKYTDIVIDTINVSLENTSYIGFSGVVKNAVYFADELMSYLYIIDKDGGVVERLMGLGRGPGELPIRSFVGTSVSQDNTLYVMGGSYDMYVFKNLKERKRKSIKVSGQKTSYEASAAYTLLSDVVMRTGNGSIYYNVIGSNEAVDPIAQKDYFDKAHYLIQVVKSMESIPIGTYSDFYKNNYGKIRHMIETYYDLDLNGNFYVSHQADSVIYFYDKEFSLISQFGFQGRDMDTDYSDPSSTEDKFNVAYVKDRKEKGYYYAVKYVDELGLLFRSYKKGSRAMTDGLQIYENNILVADLDVPANFRVAGYIAPYLITEVIADENSESVMFYRFRIN